MLIKAMNKIQSLLDSVYRTEMYDAHGFQVVRLTPDQIHKELEEAKVARAKSTMEFEKKRKEDEAKEKAILAKGGPEAEKIWARKNASYRWRKGAYNGSKAVITGFWARDRPNDERLDPLNMKIYKWKTYKMRYPHKHWFELDHMFKRLPMAPKKIYKKNRTAHGSYASLLDDGMMLTDETGKELVYTQDINGYYHQGLNTPTADEVWRAAHLGEVEEREKQRKADAEAKIYGVYPNLTQALIELGESIHSPLGFTRRDAIHKLENFREDNVFFLNLSHKKHGKGFISVRDVAGDLINFNADISRLTAEKCKERIANESGIPADEQRLYIKGKEWKNGQLLNVHIYGGAGTWIDMMRATSKSKRRSQMGSASRPTKKADVKKASLISSSVHVDEPIKKSDDKNEKGKEDKKQGSEDSKVDVEESHPFIAHSQGVAFQIDDPIEIAKWKDGHDPSKGKKDTTKSLAEIKAMKESSKQPDQIVNLVSGLTTQEKTADKAKTQKEQEDEDEEYEDHSPMFNQKHQFKGDIGEFIRHSEVASAKAAANAAKKAAEDSRKAAESRGFRFGAGKKNKATSRAPAKEKPKVTHKSDVRRTLYIKSKDGKWHVRKQKVFKGGRRMTKEEEEEWRQAEAPDYGIPVQERVEEEDEEEDEKEQQQDGTQEIGGAHSHGIHSSEEAVRPLKHASLQQERQQPQQSQQQQPSSLVQVLSSSKSTDKASTKKQKKDIATKRVNMMDQRSQRLKAKSERIQAAKK